MRIAIIGAGFCGLAVAWHLANKSPAKIVVFDAQEIGKGPSGISAGLLHAFSGAHAKRSWQADEGLLATKELLAVAEQALGTTVAKKTGMFRPAVTEQQVHDFSICAQNYPQEVHWVSAEECAHLYPDLTPYPGIFIKDCVVVDSERYLQGLAAACKANGVVFEQAKLTSLAPLSDYDRLIVAGGAATMQLPELAQLPLRAVKGQVLEFAWPHEKEPLPCPINSQAYLLMHPRKNSCLVGATFERTFASALEDPQVALAELLPKVQLFFPELNKDLLISCRAGLRAATPNHKPILSRFSEKGWAIVGMGSKGLLYHGLFAKMLTERD